MQFHRLFYYLHNCFALLNCNFLRLSSFFFPPLVRKKKSEEGNENRRKLGERTNLAFPADKCEVNMICKIAPTDVSKRKMHTRERERRDLKRESRNESIRLLLTMYDWLLLLAIFFFLFESSNYVRKRKKRERESTKEKTKEKRPFLSFSFGWS